MAEQENGRRVSFPLPTLFRTKPKRAPAVEQPSIEEPNYEKLGSYGQTGETLNERLTLLKYRFSDLESLRQDFEAVSQPVAEFLDKYASSQARLAETEALVTHMRTENRSLHDELGKLRRHSEELKLDHAQVLEEARSKDQAISRLEEQVGKRQAAIEEARITIDWQTSKILAEEQKVSGYEQLNSSLGEEVTRLENELATERAGLAALRDAAAIDSVEVGRLRDQLEALQPAHLSARRRLNELELDTQSMRQALAAADAKFSHERDARLAVEQLREQEKLTFENELAFLMSQNEAISGRNAATTKLLDQTRASLAERTEAIRHAEKAQKDTAAIAASAERRAAAAQDEARRVQAQQDEAEDRVKKIRDRCAMLTKALAAKDTQIAQLSAKMDSHSQQWDAATVRYEQERAQRDTAMRKLVEENEREKAERALAQGALTTARTSREKLLKQVEALRKGKSGLAADELAGDNRSEASSNVLSLHGNLETPDP